MQHQLDYVLRTVEERGVRFVRLWFTDVLGFLKSFERFTKERLGNAPEYQFLAKDQAKSNGSLPWTRVSPSLFLTGNTYVLLSKEQKAFLVIDPWGKRGADQVAKLRKDQQLGPLEVVMFSHAHYDHYDGVYDISDREKFQIWKSKISKLGKRK